jgi:hypothetical protein
MGGWGRGVDLKGEKGHARGVDGSEAAGGGGRSLGVRGDLPGLGARAVFYARRPSTELFGLGIGRGRHSSPPYI